jgi:Domain of unknown function (DUF4331)
MKRNRLFQAGIAAAVAVAAVAAISPRFVVASDHDDGETGTKARNVNLTDLYVFREKDQNPAAQDGDLILVMNTNPRSVARQQYFFNPNARYEFHISRANNKDAIPTGQDDIVLRYEFQQPGTNNQQEFRMTTLAHGKVLSVNGGKTTPLAPNPNAAPIVNRMTVSGRHVDVFAGLREDPFFFDVEQFFRVRAGLAKIGPSVGFRPAGQALDFAKGYNVNTIVARVPGPVMKAGSTSTVFDVWETISVRDPRNGKYTQVERLGRPAVNEGLVITNDYLNAFNSISPSQDLSAAAAPVRAEAKSVLLALGNSDQRANSLLGAFLPDVMRIDTSIPSGYVSAVNGKGSPIAGRKLLDDTIDQTLSVLSNGAVPSDNVSYNGTGSNPAQGHQPLASQFPYLAVPN